MTRRALALYLAGATAAGSAIVAAQGALWWPAAVLVFIATFLYAAADREREYARARQEAQERAARPDPPHTPSWAVCCQFWHASGTIHGPDCTRSAA